MHYRLLTFLAITVTALSGVVPNAAASGPRDCDVDPNTQCVAGGPTSREAIDPGPGNPPSAQEVSQPAANDSGQATTGSRTASRTVAVAAAVPESAQVASAAAAPETAQESTLAAAPADSQPFAAPRTESQSQTSGLPWLPALALLTIASLGTGAYYFRRRLTA